MNPFRVYIGGIGGKSSNTAPFTPCDKDHIPWQRSIILNKAHDAPVKSGVTCSYMLESLILCLH